MFEKPSRDAPIQPNMAQAPTTNAAIPDAAPMPKIPTMAGGGMRMMPKQSAGHAMADAGMQAGGQSPLNSGMPQGLNEGAAAAQVLQDRLKAFAQEMPDAINFVDEMLTEEFLTAIGILFGAEPVKLLAPMMKNDKTLKPISKNALSRIGLDKFESMMTKADEKAGIMAPGKAPPSNAGAKATQ